MIVSIDGRISSGEQARVPVIDHGLLYGDGVFEGIRMYRRRIFRLEHHLSRLHVSAKAICLQLPGGTPGVRDLLLSTARAYRAEDAYIRLVVTRGDGALGIDPTTCTKPRIICIVDSIQLYPEEKTSRGIDLVTASMRRTPADVLDPRIKSLNYLNGVLAKLEARKRGADEALLLNCAGAVAETSVANIFAASGGVLLTPPVTDGALEGITRSAVLELAETLKMPTDVRTMGRCDILGADEAFITGTGARVVKVRSLDGELIGDPDHRPITERLCAAFDHMTQTTGTPV